MATDLNAIAARLDRIEQALSSARGLGDLINHGDPPPDDLVRFRPDLLRLSLGDLLRKLRWIVDPSPIDSVRVRGSGVESRLSELLQRNPGWFVDPPPEDFLNVRVLDLIRRWRGGFTDPAPEDLANVRLSDLLQRIPGGGFTDPSPEDIGRLTRTEIETQLHKVNTEMTRVRAVERMLNERLSVLKKEG